MPLTPDEIEDLKSKLKAARKRPLNFGLCLDNDSDETVLLLHRRKAPEILLRRAKALGDTPKVAKGQLSMKGKVLTLDCDMDPPANCARQVRMFLREMGIAVKVVLNTPSGVKDSVLRADETPTSVVAATPFKKTLTLWTMTRTKMDTEMARLQSAIAETCGTDPTLKNIVAETTEFPSRMSVFDGELNFRLNDLISTPDGSSMDALKAQARATVQEYETALNDPFFADLDTKNGFAKVAVTSSAKQALAAISKALN